MEYSTKNSLAGKLFDRLGFNRKFHEFHQDFINKDENFFVSPVEARLVASGRIGKDGEIISKAGKNLRIADVVNGAAGYFSGGTYFNFYLSPENRHYWRMPYDCKTVSDDEIKEYYRDYKENYFAHEVLP